MKLKVLSQASALTPSAPLWILPPPGASHWMRKLDWYLNGLYAHKEMHQPKSLPTGLQVILREENLEIEDVKVSESSAVLIASGFHLPNTQTVVLPFHGDLQNWLIQAHGIWKQLGSASVRLFLPRKQSVDTLPQYWPEGLSDSTSEEDDRVLSVVPDQGPTPR